MPHPPRLLILETSHRRGGVAIASGDALLARRNLDEARRHTRDLTPAVREMLTQLNWRARDLDGVIVSLGPGSYTGLRVGLMSAKMLAYASGCRLLGVATFAALARQVDADSIAIVADAQQDQIYVQSFDRAGSARDALRVTSFTEGLEALPAGTCVGGPGLDGKVVRVPGHLTVAPTEVWYPDVATLLQLGLERFERGERDDPMTLEPLYLRPSSAEEKWDRRK